MKLSTLKDWAKAQAARTIWAYGPDELVTRLRKIGVTPGSTLMFHSSWRPHNGFRASPPMWCAPSRPRWGRAACW
jgi:hypothetical protein